MTASVALNVIKVVPNHAINKCDDNLFKIPYENQFFNVLTGIKYVTFIKLKHCA